MLLLSLFLLFVVFDAVAAAVVDTAVATAGVVLLVDRHY